MQNFTDKRRYYEEIIRKATLSLEDAPTEGRLRVMNNRGNYQYFLCTRPGDTRGTYIRKANRDIARALAQRDYDKKVIGCAREWLSWIDKATASAPKDNIPDLYAKAKKRTQLITPYDISDEEYRVKWEAELYDSNEYDYGETEYYTEKNERVRSKSEVIIANALKSKGIAYRYEKPLFLNDGKKIYPDFTLLNPSSRQEIYFEHFGMMDDEEYAANALDKIIIYEKNGYWPGDSFIFTMESSRRPLDMRLLNEMLDKTMLKVMR